jgi:NADH-quinone oxidoreductase subunit N
MRDYTLFIPEYIAAGSALFVLTVELVRPSITKDKIAYLTFLGAIVWGLSGLFYLGDTPGNFMEILRTDDFTTYFRLLAAGIVAVTALLSAQYMRDRTKTAGEYYGLLLTAGAGMVLMAASRELLTAYISLELLSFSLYVLVGFHKRDKLSSEASLKYVLLGAFASAMFLYGISLIYGATGTTYYEGIANALAGRSSDTDMGVIVGIMLIIAGVGFKVSAIPFHMWAPDAYEGAPMPITAFLSTASKAAGFALILRLFTGAFTVDPTEWRVVIAVLAAVTMTGGNLIAIQQTSLKRLIAYSSIGQVGYMLVVVAAIGYGTAEVGQNASSALLLHIVGYVASTLALFAALIAVYNRTGDDTIRGLRGLSERQPYLAMVITGSLFSFAGLPFFAGFTTKLFMFQASTSDALLWLVGLAVLNSFISLYYYLMIMRQMYLFDSAPDSKLKLNPLLGTVAGLLFIGVLFIGIFPGPAFDAADGAAEALFEVNAITVSGGE